MNIIRKEASNLKRLKSFSKKLLALVMLVSMLLTNGTFVFAAPLGGGG